MPFEIVRNDITNMQVDAIVNTANPKPIVGWGVDAGIHKKAGPKLLEARSKIGLIRFGDVSITPAFNLDARIVIHAVGPIWQGGNFSEEALLARCYTRALEAAKSHNCESIAFPLISAGNHGFPKPLALQIAIREISAFLMNNDMQVYLVVFGQETFRLSEKLFHSVESYIDDNYILDKTYDEYGVSDKCDVRNLELRQLSRAMEEGEYAVRSSKYLSAEVSCDDMELLPAPCAPITADLEELLSGIDAGFSETLLMLIDRTGKKDSEIYRKANVDRKLFSKIRNNPDYKPTKPTALSFAIALELNLDETQDFIARAGYTLTHSSKFDVIVEYFIVHENYNIHELNAVLFEHDQPLLCV
ncbi:MAG: RNase III inhibitor [Clostridiales bacterium]|nr:RNase III inhibitor [Clostridiales bacterium]